MTTSRVKIVMTAAMCVLFSLAVLGTAQQNNVSQKRPAVRALRVRSNVVLVPALVKTRSGEVVFALSASDFVLKDNGVPQTLQLEPDTDSEPLALVVIVETGGEGVEHLRNYGNLGPVLDAVIGDVRHQVAVVGFDSTPHLEQDFVANTDVAAETISALKRGDQGAAILDALSFGIALLRKQPPEYRRAVLLFSETADGGSQTGLEKVLREVDDTDTSIYGFAFSSTKAAVKREASKLPRPGGSPYESTPYGPGGCMARGSAPDAHGKRDIQMLDCASDLFPPLRLARMAFLAARDGLRLNVPESVAQQTGGEYFAFKNSKTLAEDLLTVSNDVHNYYILSFRPAAPTPGFHALEVGLKNRPDLKITARTAYWVDSGASSHR